MNECKDEVPCSEEKHAQNRRTELKIIGEIQDKTKFDSKNLSDDKKAPTINVIKTQ